MLNGQDDDDVLLQRVSQGFLVVQRSEGSNYPVLHSKVSVRLNDEVQGFIYY